MSTEEDDRSEERATETVSDREARLIRFLQREVPEGPWAPTTKEEREAILGYGPAGV
ncbi:hypothetical protein LZ318_13140 [Saccharopolyspora indica]|uniref:hypothetical protein n=1 Tax=Saccharopolyspora indica TaxID=1229659 RepID=UPI0022EB5388|nr:hypothetical protein [Saccharopolyspora indica]MDA3647159.1 hypothetical protein [Saccharopolyspora indica]